MPSHAFNYCVLILPLTILGVLMPQGFLALAGAVALTESIQRLSGKQ